MDGFDFRIVEAGPFQLSAIARGPAAAPLVLIVPPLFEEMNRSRRLMADLGRALADREIASILPDLPGTGDSLGDQNIVSWQSAIASLIAIQPCHVVTIRGASLLTDGMDTSSLYRFCPVSFGAILLREMMRAQSIADQERTGGGAGVTTYENALKSGRNVSLAGYELTPRFAGELADLQLPEPAVRCRTADLRPGQDIAFEGPPVWRQPDPAPTAALAEYLAGDIAEWLR